MQLETCEIAVKYRAFGALVLKLILAADLARSAWWGIDIGHDFFDVQGGCRLDSYL